MKTKKNKCADEAKLYIMHFVINHISMYSDTYSDAQHSSSDYVYAY